MYVPQMPLCQSYYVSMLILGTRILIAVATQFSEIPVRELGRKDMNHWLVS